MALNARDDPTPEPALDVRLLDRAAADDRDAQRVHAVADQPEQRGQERERGEHGDDPDEDRSDGQAPHHGRRDDQHPEHRDDERAAAEEDGAAGRGARGRDGRVTCSRLVPALLAVTRDDEQRVVDPEREPHRDEHVHDEHRELDRLRHERGQPERDDDRDDRHQQRDEPGDDRAEDEQEDDQRRGQAELELARLQVVLRQLVEVVVERLVAGDGDEERRIAVRPLDDGKRDRRRRRPSTSNGTISRVPVLRHERRVVSCRTSCARRATASVAAACAKSVRGEGPELRAVDGVAVGAHDGDVRDGRRADRPGTPSRTRGARARTQGCSSACPRL